MTSQRVRASWTLVVTHSNRRRPLLCNIDAWTGPDQVRAATDVFAELRCWPRHLRLPHDRFRLGVVRNCAPRASPTYHHKILKSSMIDTIADLAWQLDRSTLAEYTAQGMG